MPTYQVPYEVFISGTMTMDAPDAEAARQDVLAMRFEYLLDHGDTNFVDVPSAEFIESKMISNRQRGKLVNFGKPRVK